MLVNNKANLAPVMMPLSMTPAPAPTMNAWMKPINFSTTTVLVGSQLQQMPTASQTVLAPQQMPAAASDVKLDKEDQHDSGIDVNDQQNSAASSTRSSPGTDNRLIISATIPHSPSMDLSTTAAMLKVPVHYLSASVPIMLLFFLFCCLPFVNFTSKSMFECH